MARLSEDELSALFDLITDTVDKMGYEVDLGAARDGDVVGFRLAVSTNAEDAALAASADLPTAEAEITAGVRGVDFEEAFDALGDDAAMDALGVRDASTL